MIHCTFLGLAVLWTVRALRLLLVTNQKAERVLALNKFTVNPGLFTDISPPISYTPIPIRQGLWKVLENEGSYHESSLLQVHWAELYQTLSDKNKKIVHLIYF